MKARALPEQKKLRVLVVGMSPSIVQRGERIKGIALAPLLLKAYADDREAKKIPSLIEILARTFFVDEESPEEITPKILAEKPDIVAFSVYVWNYNEAMECARIIKDITEEVMIICGGPQVAPVAEEVMREHPYIDSVTYLAEFGEVVLYQFITSIVEKKSLDTVAGIVYRTPDGLLARTKPLGRNLVLSSVPSPYLNGSFLSAVDADESYSVTLESIRGCPMDCGYCFFGYGTHGSGKVRHFGLEKLLQEIEIVYNHPHIKQVIHADSDMLLNGDRAKVMFSHIIKQNSQAQCNISISIINLTEDVAKLLVRLPKCNLFFGIQTVNPKALSLIGRLRPSIDEFRSKFEAFQKWVPNTTFTIELILGLPGDDLVGFKQSLDACLSFEPTRIRAFYPLYLLPGTRFFEHRKELGLHHNDKPPLCVIETDTFSKADICSAWRLAFWVDVLTYYYPAIGDFFHKVCAGFGEGERIARIEKWHTIIEKKVDVFGSYPNPVDIATSGSTQDWNELRSKLLLKVSQADSACQIYRTIQEEERVNHADCMHGGIDLGVRIFDYMRSQGMDSVEFEQFDKLPPEIIGAYSENEVRPLFSRYTI